MMVPLPLRQRRISGEGQSRLLVHHFLCSVKNYSGMFFCLFRMVILGLGGSLAGYTGTGWVTGWLYWDWVGHWLLLLSSQDLMAKVRAMLATSKTFQPQSS